MKEVFIRINVVWVFCFGFWGGWSGCIDVKMKQLAVCYPAPCSQTRYLFIFFSFEQLAFRVDYIYYKKSDRHEEEEKKRKTNISLGSAK